MRVSPLGGCIREPVGVWHADRTKHGHGRFLYARVTSGVEGRCSHSACSHREPQLALALLHGLLHDVLHLVLGDTDVDSRTVQQHVVVDVARSTGVVQLV